MAIFTSYEPVLVRFSTSSVSPIGSLASSITRPNFEGTVPTNELFIRLATICCTFCRGIESIFSARLASLFSFFPKALIRNSPCPPGRKYSLMASSVGTNMAAMSLLGFSPVAPLL